MTTSADELREQVRTKYAESETIAYRETRGCLHEDHCRVLEEAI
jgi:pantothenate synthetase